MCQLYIRPSMQIKFSIQISCVVPHEVAVGHVSFCTLLFTEAFHWDQLAGAVVLQARVAEGAYDRLPDLRLMDARAPHQDAINSA